MQSIRHFACALALWLPATACLATTAYLQPQAIFEGDIVELLIEYDSKIPSLYALDTTPLETEFEILDTRSRVMRIDGKGEDLHRMQWRLQLLPRSSGNLTVPALSFGNQTSPPLRLEVRPVPESVRASQQVIVELDADPPAPYVGQQTRVIHRLLHNTPVRIDGLAEPGISGLTRFSDREERVYFVERDGGEFRVLERRMDIFPQSAGTLRLPPVVFRGELREAAAEQGDLPGRKISRSSEPLDLQVREPPAEYAGRYWLPARSLEISQKLQPHAAELAVGDSIDWTLVLVARGLTAESLPENLLRTESENFTVYADQASRSNRFEGSDLVGRLEQRFAVIVTGDGPIELPDITLDWWDVTADSPRRARLEGGSIGIARAAANGARDAGDRDFADAMFFSSASGGIEWTRLT
ncbi:MAG: BatD family protein, partial [Gammaproteobacteria bacterium]